MGLEGWLTLCRVMAGRAVQATIPPHCAAPLAIRPGVALPTPILQAFSSFVYSQIELASFLIDVCTCRSSMQGMLLRTKHEGGIARI